ncbi:2-hydroxyacid dehydrogenase [Sedimentibacter sp.]|uniref:2-hydroxyacid dehydrogenase n=1 Tax=Sedimentibacter sp. TaxID=1960295 RepID=UPI0028A687C5|nr:2-hydroxyacid dehydrogenase [Sedimentibacter sp.]
MSKVTIVGKYPDEAYELITKGLSDKFELDFITEQDDLNKISDLEYVILRTLKIDENIIRNNKNLKLIQRWGAGYDTVDIQEANRRNIPVTVANGINSCAVAEHTILLILALYRHLVQLNNKVKEGVWDRTTYASNSYTINGKRVGLIGLGAIGKMVALKTMALGAEVVYYDLYRLDKEQEESLNVKFLKLDELLRSSDIVSIHLPLTSDTVDLITRHELDMMKKNAVIVNTSRGGIIKENDLADILATGNILGAGLDSFEKEPYPRDGRFNGIDNIIMTPHIGGTVDDLIKPMAEKVTENIMRVHENKGLNKRDYINHKDCSYPAE